MQSSAVRKARANDVQQLAALLAAAFYQDPVWGSYFLPDKRRRLAGLTRFFAGELRQFLPYELVWDHRGSGWGVGVGAAWTLASAAMGVLRGAPSIARTFGRQLPRVLRATTMVEKQHRHDPHYYLPYIGVAPARQGNGLGTALLRPVLDRCDAQGVPAYLEATNKRNLPLYRRQGVQAREDGHRPAERAARVDDVASAERPIELPMPSPRPIRVPRRHAAGPSLGRSLASSPTTRRRQR
jgi:GNAT superfamily N-acetyltransferase